MGKENTVAEITDMEEIETMGEGNFGTLAFSVRTLKDQCSSPSGKKLWAQYIRPNLLSKWIKSVDAKKREKKISVVPIDDDVARFHRYYPKPLRDRICCFVGHRFYSVVQEKQHLFIEVRSKLIPYGTQLTIDEISEYYKRMVRGRYADWVYGVQVVSGMTTDYIFNVDDQEFIDYMLNINKVARIAMDVKESGDGESSWNTWTPKSGKQKEKLSALVSAVKEGVANCVVSKWNEYKEILQLDGFDEPETLSWFMKNITKNKLEYYSYDHSVKDFIRDAELMVDVGLKEIFTAADAVEGLFEGSHNFNFDPEYILFKTDTIQNMGEKTKVYKDIWG